MSAAPADVPASGPVPSPEGSGPAGRGSQRRPAWVPAGHDLPDPNPLCPTDAKGGVLRSDVAERVVQQGPVVPCIRCLERWQLNPMEPCYSAHPGSYVCLKCSRRQQGCVLVRSPSSYYCLVY